MRQAEQSVGGAATGAVLERVARRILDQTPDRLTIVRLARFGVSGVIATGVHVAIATPLALGIGVSPVVANGVAFVCATVFSYLLNALWSFSAKPSRDNFLRFVCVAVFGLLLTLAISWTAQRLGANYWVGLCAILMMVPPITFVLHRTWTFR
ncbi:GtrA family protein [Ralstonia sp. UBA689]|uniref:GtrA family protein n=1 Tax=Ralstonia sp. UBA689 TaxID=1947373 RepID=UPI0025F847D1|nr:GtrA family protein [Ralstonia sp. UBA689]